MTYEAQMTRLTALAQRIWTEPEEQPVTVQNGLRGVDTYTAFVLAGSVGVVLDVAAPNDRAMEALEAAMLVIAGIDDRAHRNAELEVRLDEAKQRIARDHEALSTAHFRVGELTARVIEARAYLRLLPAEAAACRDELDSILSKEGKLRAGKEGP